MRSSRRTPSKRAISRPSAPCSDRRATRAAPESSSPRARRRRASIATPANTSGSRGDVLNNNGASQPLADERDDRSDRDAREHHADVHRARSVARRRRRCAPSATRTPISCVRCVTLYAMTLYRPIVASTSASPPKTANIVAPSRHERVAGARTSDIVFDREVRRRPAAPAANRAATTRASSAGSPRTRSEQSNRTDRRTARSAGSRCDPACRSTNPPNTMFSATPTTMRHGIVSALIFTHLPIGLSFGQNARAIDSLTTITCGAPARSSAVDRAAVDDARARRLEEVGRRRLQHEVAELAASNRCRGRRRRRCRSTRTGSTTRNVALSTFGMSLRARSISVRHSAARATESSFTPRRCGSSHSDSLGVVAEVECSEHSEGCGRTAPRRRATRRTARLARPAASCARATLRP